MSKKLTSVLLFLLLMQISVNPLLAAKNCANTSVGFIPLIDMGANQLYKGQSGGLYVNGSNSVPLAHLQMAQIAAGQVKPVNGKIGFISVGMSNVSQEFIVFQELVDSDPGVQNSIVTVNGAQSGQSADRWVTPEPGTNPWSVLSSRISSAGLSKEQVQVVWLKQANRDTAETPGLEDAMLLKSNLVYMVKKLKTDYPAIKIIYVSSRIYAGYASGHSSIEPLAYESGFAFRWLIQDQMGITNPTGTSEIDYNNSPVIVWAPYIWADGLNPRSDGLVWKCEDFQDDGGHPSASGELKVAQMLMNFFKTSPLAASWFTGSAPPPTMNVSPSKTPTPPSGQKPGDANGDNKVDGLDYVVWLNNYNKTVSNGSASGDFDGNGKVDGLDYVIWLVNYNK